MCKAMDIPLPLLPFSGKAELELFKKMMIANKEKINEVDFALEWCKHVDPDKDIHAKLPCHIRVQLANFDRSQRIQDTLAKAKRGKDAVDELHASVLPEIQDEVLHNPAPENDLSRKTTEKSPSRKRKSAAAGLTHTLMEPSLPAPFPLPLPQAIHASPFIQYGGMIVVEIPPSQPLPQKKSVCTLCKRFNGMNAHLCPGKSRHTLCKYFTKEGAPKYAMPPVHHCQRARKRC